MIYIYLNNHNSVCGEFSQYCQCMDFCSSVCQSVDTAINAQISMKKNWNSKAPEPLSERYNMWWSVMCVCLCVSVWLERVYNEEWLEYWSIWIFKRKIQYVAIGSVCVYVCVCYLL